MDKPTNTITQQIFMKTKSVQGFTLTSFLDIEIDEKEKSIYVETNDGYRQIGYYESVYESDLVDQIQKSFVGYKIHHNLGNNIKLEI